MAAKTWIALLRGINVGRNKRVAMSDLRRLLEDAGYDQVRTLLQSGNALFDAGGSAAAHEKAIEAGIRRALRMDVKVLVRSAQEFAAVVDANPFLAGTTTTKPFGATFLAAQPPAEKVKALDPEQFAPDEFAFGKRVIYTVSPAGFAGSKLPDWGRLLGMTVTARNWNTVTRLRDLAASSGATS